MSKLDNLIPFHNTYSSFPDDNNFVLVCFSKELHICIELLREQKKEPQTFPQIFLIDTDLALTKRIDYLWKKYSLKFVHRNDIGKNVYVYINPKENACGQNSFYRMFYLLGVYNINNFSYNVNATSLLFDIGIQKLDPRIVHDDICSRTRELFYDEESKIQFDRIIKSRIAADPSYLKTSAYPRFFHPVVNAHYGDSIVDGGILDGETTEVLRHECGYIGKLIGFEAFNKFANNSKKYLSDYGNIGIVNLGLWDIDTTLQIKEHINPNWTRMQFDKETDTIPVKAISLDNYFKPDYQCDFLKLNIEGAELRALIGARNFLKRNRPRMQIATFHAKNLIFEVPQFINDELENYAIFLGHHTPYFEQTYVYAIPKEKLPKGRFIAFGLKQAFNQNVKYFINCQFEQFLFDDVLNQDFDSKAKHFEHLFPSIPIIMFSTLALECFLYNKLINLSPLIDKRRIFKSLII